MFRKIFITLVAVMLTLSVGKSLFAMCGRCEAQVQTTEEKSEPVEVGNKICPVSGEEIDEEMKVTYEYEGKIYNFCCSSCIEEFKKDPEKYIKKVEEELEAEHTHHSHQH